MAECFPYKSRWRWIEQVGKGWSVKHFRTSSTCPKDWVPRYRNINMHVHMHHTSIYTSIHTYARTRTHSHALARTRKQEFHIRSVKITIPSPKRLHFFAVCGKSSCPERTRYRSLATVNHPSRERTRYRSLATVNHPSRERTRYRSLTAVNHPSRERTRYRSLATVNHPSHEQSKTGKPKYTHHKLNLGQYNEVLRHEY